MTQRRTLLAAAAALGLAPRLAAAQQRFASIYMFVPAGPGGGWDGLGRAIEQAARAGGLVGTFQFENVGGAGGTVGLPRFLAQRRGRADALMVSGSVMVGATLTKMSAAQASYIGVAPQGPFKAEQYRY
jgi:putative tricarboxylic transport membrane protein